MRSSFAIGGVMALCVGVMWLITVLYRELLEMYEQSGAVTDLDFSWVFRLLLNMVGYSTVLVPGFIMYKYIEKTNYFDKITSGSGLSRALYACFGSHERLPDAAAPAPAAAPTDSRRDGLELLFCFTGLMGAYLVWGLLQEKIMTQSYELADGSVVRFSDSQFLVFVNRFCALAVAAARLAATGRPLLGAPLRQYSYCALSNVLSAWCQYEALKYVSFPTQVLSKSCKVIPVMAMGALVSRHKYAPYEYATALAISLGMVLFLTGSREDAAWGGPTLSGFGLLALYLSCDAFTASWQAALFARHRVRPLQMLCAVNAWSAALTAAALAQRADTARSLALLRDPAFAADAALLSASSTLGQLLIYRTIARFGAVTFTIIMTLRQAASILLSCAVYGHAVSAAGAAGVVLVFAAALARVYCAQRVRRRARAAAAAAPRLA